MAQDGLPRELIIRLSRTVTAPESPRYRFGVPMGVLRCTCYSLEASTGFLGHGAST